MLVIADSSPLIVLVNIGHVDVLPRLFGKIVIPPAVISELSSAARPDLVRKFAGALPAWLEVLRPKNVLTLSELHPGETEAISLALELNADLILVDERGAYKEAVARKLNAIGTIRVLERAAMEGFVDLKTAFDKLKQSNFWISHKLLDERLRLLERQFPRD